MILTSLALLSHGTPISLRSRPVYTRSGLNADGSVAPVLLHSPLPQPDVMKEVFSSVHAGCMRAPREWGKPTRVLLPEEITTDPPLLVYNDVLVASDPVCARLTRARHGSSGRMRDVGGASPPNASDSERIVWTTHLNRGRFASLVELEQRWGGCMSVSLWLCKEEDWDFMEVAFAREKGIGQHVTFHVVLGHGAYPYNLQRNVALSPFAPWNMVGRPEPWVLIADADGVPSVGEASMMALMRDATAGRLTAPQTLSGALPESLKWMAVPNELNVGAPGVRAEPAPPPKVDTAVCDAWDGYPQPMQCRPNGHPSGLGWASQGDVTEWARARSRCGRPVNERGSFFVIPSFDTKRDNNHVIRRLYDIPGDAPPSHAFAYLRSLKDHGVVEIQAFEGYPPSYVAMVPWNAWLSDDPAGLLAIHYAFIYEPYVIMKAPAPSTSFDRWEPFDEYFRDPGYDKCVFFVETAGLPRDDPSHFDMFVLPQVFLINRQGSGGPKNGGRHINWERFMNARGEHGLHCQDMCPCVPIANATVPPPQGFHGGNPPRRRRVSEAEPQLAASETQDSWTRAEAELIQREMAERPMPPAYNEWRASRGV